jgi:hypothetical protein
LESVTVATKHLKEVTKAARRVQISRDALADAILAANESGESYREIAPYAGLSHTQVGDLANQAKERRRSQAAD